MSIELYVRFGRYKDEEREVRTYHFDTEGERQAFIDGMWMLSSNTNISQPGSDYDIVLKREDGSFEPDGDDDGDAG